MPVPILYEGLDKVTRISSIAFGRAPDVIDAEHAEFKLLLQQRTRDVLYLEIGADPAPSPGEERFRNAAARARVCMRNKRRRGASLRSSGRLFSLWIDKSRADLALLETDMPTGPYPFAGIPWFSTPFGRDAIVTSKLPRDRLADERAERVLVHARPSAFDALLLLCTAGAPSS